METKHNSIPVFDIDGKKVSEQTFADWILSRPVNERLIAQYVRVYLANQRSGNAHTKTRSEVTGTTQKVYRQKGTGRARHGSKKAALFTGGGVTFGPRTRDISLKISKKQRRKALSNALHLMLDKQRVLSFNDSYSSLEPKTKVLSNCFSLLPSAEKKTLLIVKDTTNNPFCKAAGNIKHVTMTTAHSINPYEILNTEYILFTPEALETVNTFFADSPNA